METEADWEHLRTHETYLGYGRGNGLASPNAYALNESRLYELPERLGFRRWTIGCEKVVLEPGAEAYAFTFG